MLKHTTRQRCAFSGPLFRVGKPPAPEPPDLRQSVDVFRCPCHRREIRSRERIPFDEPRDRAAHRVLHQRRQRVGRKASDGGRTPHQLGGRGGGGPTPGTPPRAPPPGKTPRPPPPTPRPRCRGLTPRGVCPAP